MRPRAKIILFLLFAGSFLLSLTHCKKARLNRSVISCEDHALAQLVYSDIIKQTQGSLELVEAGTNIEWLGCANYTVDSLGTPFPLAIVLDFGQNNCISLDGKRRRGRLIIRLINSFDSARNTIIVQPDNYFFDDISVKGEMTLNLSNLNNQMFSEFEFIINNGSVDLISEPEIRWTATQVWTFAAGSETGYFDSLPDGEAIYGPSAQDDDLFQISETTSGVNRDGFSFESKTLESLGFDVGCGYITEGIVEIIPENLDPRELNYGNGNCDSGVDVKIEDREYTFNIMD